MPRPLSNRVLVRHVDGSEKEVLRSNLGSLSPSWTRVNPYDSPPAVQAEVTSPFASLPDVAAIPQEPPTEVVEESPDEPTAVPDANPEQEQS